MLRFNGLAGGRFSDDDRWRGVRIRYDWAGQKREMESLVGNRHSRREWWEI
jgi:hypothetical protein